jgi:hypothetical protein
MVPERVERFDRCGAPRTAEAHAAFHGRAEMLVHTLCSSGSGPRGHDEARSPCADNQPITDLYRLIADTT